MSPTSRFCRLLNATCRPLGLSTKWIVEDLPLFNAGDSHCVSLTFSGQGKMGVINETYQVYLPTLGTDGAYCVDGLNYVPVPVAYLDRGCAEIDYYVVKASVILARGVSDTLSRTFNKLFLEGVAPSEEKVQASLNTKFKTLKTSLLVDPDNAAERAAMADSVYLTSPYSELDVDKWAFPKSMLGKLDPATTSSSGTINQVFRLVEGANILNQRIVEGTGMFSRTIEDSGIGLGFTPKRLNLLSAQFSQAIKLVSPETPTVKGPNNCLDGRELVTAVMDLGGDTYEDAFMVSESAASKLTCIRRYRVRTHGDVRINVVVGQRVTRKTTLCEIDDEFDSVRKSCKKVFKEATVVEITSIPSTLRGVPTTRHDIIVEEHQVMQTGDKMTTRGGLKGVAIVRPDADMPATEDGSPCDIVVSPKSVYNRQSVVTLWEMMMNLKGESFTSVPEIDTPFKCLGLEGWGKKTQLIYKGELFEHETFTAPLYFFRLDKLAHEILASADSNQVCDSNGLVVDKSTNGQRMDLSMQLAISAKGMGKMFDYYTNTKAPEFIRRVAKALKPSLRS